jgi:hypothetical protein
MKRISMSIILVLLFLVFLSTSALASSAENESFKFRGYEWGTPLEKIKEKEITDDMIDGFHYAVDEDNKSLSVMTTVANVTLFALFNFDNDWNLDYGFYVPQITLVKSDIEYYSEYETIDNALVGLYGEPEKYATNVDIDDVENMSRNEIISKITQDNAVIVHRWVAEDGSEIYSTCLFFGGHVRGEYYYVQSEEQFQEIVAKDSDTNTEGL